MTDKYRLDTLAVRAGQQRSQFGEHAEALYLTSSFVFDSASQAAARFAGTEEGMVYARFSNPTVATMQDRLAALEGAEGCIATASGMSAILATVMALLKAGDHIVAARSLFGATQQMFGNIFARFGVDTSFVAGTRPDGFRAAMRPNTKLVFIETPSARLSCNDRCNWGQTWSSTLRPSISMVRAECSVVPSVVTRRLPMRFSSFCVPPGRPCRRSMPG
jgi:O-succinylhomoserine sulfhydrylase